MSPRDRGDLKVENERCKKVLRRFLLHILRTDAALPCSSTSKSNFMCMLLSSIAPPTIRMIDFLMFVFCHEPNVVVQYIYVQIAVSCALPANGF